MTDKAQISFKCKKCGEKLSWSDDAIDSTLIICKKCGQRFGTYADLRHTAVEATKSKLESMLKDAIKRR
jgi:DNA-directed RNA polymerase subunit RPC12/RpoP